MSWYYLALSAPLLFAIVTLIDDNLIHHVFKSPYYGAIIAGLFGAVPLASLVLRPLGYVSPLVLLIALAAGFLTTLYYFFYFRALEIESPSVVIAMFGLSPVLVLIFARLFLGEQLLSRQIIGFMIVLVASLGLGVIEVRKFKFSKALLFVLIAASLYSAASLCSKYVFLHIDFYTGFMCFSAGMGLGGVYFLLVLKYLGNNSFIRDLRHNSKKVILIFIAAEAISVAAEFTQSLAISKGPISLVKVIEGVQPIYVLLIAMLFYRFAPRYFREAAEGGLIKKFTFMALGLAGLFLIHLSS